MGKFLVFHFNPGSSGLSHKTGLACPASFQFILFFLFSLRSLFSKKNFFLFFSPRKQKELPVELSILGRLRQ
jgi:hypothetical protein